MVSSITTYELGFRSGDFRKHVHVILLITGCGGPVRFEFPMSLLDSAHGPWTSNKKVRRYLFGLIEYAEFSGITLIAAFLFFFIKTISFKIFILEMFLAKYYFREFLLAHFLSKVSSWWGYNISKGWKSFKLNTNFSYENLSTLGSLIAKYIYQ